MATHPSYNKVPKRAKGVWGPRKNQTSPGPARASPEPPPLLGQLWPALDQPWASFGLGQLWPARLALASPGPVPET